MSDQEILQSLRKAIELDRNYFVKAKIDKNLDPIRSQVDRLLENILQETKTKAEQGISGVDSIEKRMEEWFKKCYVDVKRHDKDIRNIHRIGHLSLIALGSGIVMWLIGLMLADKGDAFYFAFSLSFIEFIWLSLSLNFLLDWSESGFSWGIAGLIAVIFIILIIGGEIPVFSGLLSLLGPPVSIIAIAYYLDKKPSYDLKTEQRETKKQIESLKQRISVAEKSVVPLTEEEEFEDLFEALPDELKEALEDEKLLEKADRIGERFRNSEEAIEELAAISEEVLLGTLPLSKLARELEEKLDLTPEIAKNLAHELDSEIFSEFKGSLGG